MLVGTLGDSDNDWIDYGMDNNFMNNNSFKCPDCEFVAADEESLIDHRYEAQHHMETSVTPPNENEDIDAILDTFGTMAMGYKDTYRPEKTYQRMLAEAKASLERLMEIRDLDARIEQVDASISQLNKIKLDYFNIDQAIESDQKWLDDLTNKRNELTKGES